MVGRLFTYFVCWNAVCEFRLGFDWGCRLLLIVLDRCRFSMWWFVVGCVGYACCAIMCYCYWLLMIAVVAYGDGFCYLVL